MMGEGHIGTAPTTGSPIFASATPADMEDRFVLQLVPLGACTAIDNESVSDGRAPDPGNTQPMPVVCPSAAFPRNRRTTSTNS